MTRMNPLRRVVAAVAIVGVTGFGGVALAGPALADDSAPAVSVKVDTHPLVVVLPKADPVKVGTLMSSIHEIASLPIQSPLPDGPVTFVIAKQKLTLPAQLSQSVQTVAANVYAQMGYQYIFNSQGVLVFGVKICDPKKPIEKQTDCVAADAPRF